MDITNSRFKRHDNSAWLRRAAALLAALAWSNAAFCGEIDDAARRGDVDKVRALLKDNPDWVFSKDISGASPLHWVALLGRDEVAELLLTNRAEVDAKDRDGETALLWAAYMGQKGVVELLLGSKADANAKDNCGITALHAAAQYGHKDVVELLLASKADVNVKNNVGETPLYFAAAQSQKDMVEFLREHGADETNDPQSDLSKGALGQAAARRASLNRMRAAVWKDQDAIQGTWKIVTLEFNWRYTPAEMVAVLKLVFKGDTLTFRPGEPGATDFKFELGPFDRPPSFAMTHLEGTAKGVPTKGIYLLEGDRLKICIGDGVKNPTEFTAEAGSGQGMYSLEREK